MEVRSRRRRISPIQEAEEAIKNNSCHPSYLEVREFGPKGRGIVTLKPLGQGDFVTYYHGREVDCVPEGANDTYYYEIAVNSSQIWIDASAEDGSFGRLINDSERAFNIRPKRVEFEGRHHIAFFATCRVDIGEELTYNYCATADYWWRKDDKKEQKEEKKRKIKNQNRIKEVKRPKISAEDNLAGYRTHPKDLEKNSLFKDPKNGSENKNLAGCSENKQEANNPVACLENNQGNKGTENNLEDNGLVRCSEENQEDKHPGKSLENQGDNHPPRHSDNFKDNHPPRHSENPKDNHPPRCSEDPKDNHPPRCSENPEDNHPPRRSENPEDNHPPRCSENPKDNHPPRRSENPEDNHPPRPSENPEDNHPPRCSESPEDNHPPRRSENPEDNHPPRRSENPKDNHPPRCSESPEDNHPPRRSENPEDNHPPRRSENPEDNHPPRRSENPKDNHPPRRSENPKDNHPPRCSENPEDNHPPRRSENPEDNHPPRRSENPEDNHPPRRSENPKDNHPPRRSENPKDNHPPRRSENPEDNHPPRRSENPEDNHPPRRSENPEDNHPPRRSENPEDNHPPRRSENPEDNHPPRRSENPEDNHPPRRSENPKDNHPPRRSENPEDNHPARRSENPEDNHPPRRSENPKDNHPPRRSENPEDNHPPRRSENPEDNHPPRRSENLEDNHPPRRSENPKEDNGPVQCSEYNQKDNQQMRSSGNLEDNCPTRDSDNQEDNCQTRHSENKQEIKQPARCSGNNYPITHLECNQEEKQPTTGSMNNKHNNCPDKKPQSTSQARQSENNQEDNSMAECPKNNLEDKCLPRDSENDYENYHQAGYSENAPEDYRSNTGLRNSKRSTRCLTKDPKDVYEWDDDASSLEEVDDDRDEDFLAPLDNKESTDDEIDEEIREEETCLARYRTKKLEVNLVPTLSKNNLDGNRPTKASDNDPEDICLVNDQIMDLEDPYKDITIQSTSNNDKRTWDKIYYCLFCEKPQKKIPRHLTTQHKDEPQVIDYHLEKDPKVKKLKLAKLRNMGNHKHNCDVFRNLQGELIVGYRPTGPASAADYGPCETCYVYLVRTDLWKHKCPAKGIQTEEEVSNKRKRPALTSKLLIPSPKGINPHVHKLLLSLNDDDVGRAIRGDGLLIELARREYLNHGHDVDQHNDIRQTVRRMGRFLVELRKHTALCLDLETFINPMYFRDVLNAARTVAGFEDGTNKYAKASLALKIGHSIKRLAKVVEGMGMESFDEEMEKRGRSFVKLCEINWTEEISTNAHRTLHDNRRNRVKVLPFTEDIVCISKYLKNQTHLYAEDLRLDINALASWKELNRILLARIIVFNRRRSGEASKMRIDDFNKRALPSGQKVVLDSLSPIEQELCRSLHRIEIVGKRSRTVPVLLTRDMVDAIELLIAKRRNMGVDPNNPFLFPRANYGSLGHIRGCDCLRELAEESDCKSPTLLRSTGLRKQIATVSQIVNLKDNELDILATFLGHDIRIHREYYRLPEETIQVAKVSKLLLASEQGLKDLQGKTLDEISIGVDEELEEAKSIADLEKEVEDEDREEADDLQENAHGKDHAVDDKIPVGNEKVGARLKEEKPRKTKGVKRPWSLEEKAAVLRHLGMFLAKNKLPGKKEIDGCLRAESILCERSWRNVKDFCRNRMLTNDPLQA